MSTLRETIEDAWFFLSRLSILLLIGIVLFLVAADNVCRSTPLPCIPSQHGAFNIIRLACECVEK
ncbi:MAG: hypothetical protein ACHREM_00285 [Polyangiales bacterium]